MANDTLNKPSFPLATGSLAACLLASGLIAAAPYEIAAAPYEPPYEIEPPQAYDDDRIEIVEGENRTIYEYRQNGVLTMIKVVPENGRAYYMVPADGSAHYESLDHKKNLYPQWVIVEW